MSENPTLVLYSKDICPDPTKLTEDAKFQVFRGADVIADSVWVDAAELGAVVSPRRHQLCAIGGRNFSSPAMTIRIQYALRTQITGAMQNDL